MKKNNLFIPLIKQKSFTLAETLIVTAVLGIITVLVVPQLIKRQIEIEKRTKLKKAMVVYDFLMNKMIIENDLHSNTDLKNWSTLCSNSSKYFKIAKTDETDPNGCRFKTTDGVWWNIENIQQPIVAFKQDDLNTDTAAGENTKAFYLTGHFDNHGILRVSDKAYENRGETTGADDMVEDGNKAMNKLYAFLNNKKYIPENTCDYLCQIKNTTAECPSGCEDTNSCKSCKKKVYCIDSSDNCSWDYYNNTGTRIGDISASGYISTSPECNDTNSGKTCKNYSDCMPDSGYCTEIYVDVYDSKNNLIKTTEYDSCINGENCGYTHVKYSNNTVTTYCDGNVQNCVTGFEIDNINLQNYGYDNIPFSSTSFEHSFIKVENEEDISKVNSGNVPDNYTAYFRHGNSAFGTANYDIERNDYNNMLQVENGNVVKAGEYNPENGTTWEADIKTGKVTFYNNCEGYKYNCSGPTQTGDISNYFN